MKIGALTVVSLFFLAMLSFTVAAKEMTEDVDVLCKYNVEYVKKDFVKQFSNSQLVGQRVREQSKNNTVTVMTNITTRFQPHLAQILLDTVTKMDSILVFHRKIDGTNWLAFIFFDERGCVIAPENKIRMWTYPEKFFLDVEEEIFGAPA